MLDYSFFFMVYLQADRSNIKTYNLKERKIMMNRRMIAFIMMLVLLVSMLCACGGKKSSVLTPEEAQKIVLKDAGLSAKDVEDIHTHVETYEGTACYNIHITLDGEEYSYLIDAKTGDILYSDDIA